MQRIAIIGAGISGLSTAHFLKDTYSVTLFEKESSPGGLIRCRSVNGSLFHTCGGHVFNSKRQDVLEWFWSHFLREQSFIKANRNSCVFLDSSPCVVPYPIENHVYCFDETIQAAFYKDLDEIDVIKGVAPKFTDYDNLGDFLRWRFGKTLYDIYFEPYNKKIWRRDLSTIPMFWMEGKLPMPSTQEMRDNNFYRVEERTFVHSSFWYEKQNGSQYIVDKLSEGLNIKYNMCIDKLSWRGEKWFVGDEEFDKIVFCGNIKDLPDLLEGIDITTYKRAIEELEYHGTTAVFCEIDANPYSWIYLPSNKYKSHRIICTGNFAPSNNAPSLPDGRITATIEFTDEISKKDILENLTRMPLHPSYIDHQYNRYTYPIQHMHTRDLIRAIKRVLAPSGFYLTGRFAEWEYYNMDVAIGAAMDLCKLL